MTIMKKQKTKVWDGNGERKERHDRETTKAEFEIAKLLKFCQHLCIIYSTTCKDQFLQCDPPSALFQNELLPFPPWSVAKENETPSSSSRTCLYVLAHCPPGKLKTLDFSFKLIPMNRQGPVPKITLADLGSTEPVCLRTRGSARSRAPLNFAEFF